MIGWIVRGVVAVVIVAVIVRFVVMALRHYFSGSQISSDEPSTMAVSEAGIRFRCENCGLEVLVLELPELDEKNEMPPLRHCRDEMDLMDEPGDAELST